MEAVDMTGWVMKEHGILDSKLTVLYKTDDYISPNGKHETRYHCKCECGNECDAISYLLKRKNKPIKSCGCYRIEANKVKRDREVEEIIASNGSFANSHQELMYDWDWDKNNEIGVNPYAIANHSGTNVFWKCKECNHEWKSSVNERANGRGCPVCAGRIVGGEPEYKNSIWSSKYREYFSNYMTEEQMKAYTPYSHSKINVRCPDCTEYKNIIICNLLTQGLGCRCGDGKSYPNKFLYALLDQLNIEYINEYSPSWANKKSYDIYIPNLQCIIENNGMQHYKETQSYGKTRNLKEEQENDEYKKQIAIDNKILHYIILDCRYSKLEWIKNSILSSELPLLLNFDEHTIDWEQCDIFAKKNLVKELCEYYNDNSNILIKDLSEIFHINKLLVGQWLTIGNKYGWCKYSDEDRYRRSSDRTKGKNNPAAKCAVRLSDGKLYETLKDAAIENNISFSWMSQLCKQRKGFMYYDEWIKMQEI